MVYTARFRRAYHRLQGPDQHLVDHALAGLAEYLETGRAAMGLGLKNLGPGGFEARAGLGLRIVYVEDGNRVMLALLGNHDEVRRFLRRQ
mgnify:FL=1